ncbi:uncharacterized protein Z520_10876 [Fonsecaea multimorphosa CBS 102226]|uniref:NADH:flavin oxidoreductase/NADH oxidase N-terminal domain-containing protein n=1 Tax=Fonsecaea multimorphosa CBS 102226 TaxID=1442371 RepID=A0A0D2I8F3_9EURO|nr:uncharacterized protein Z520_10876 [Fonsecaea multimorphosa CBS 102226]KIX93456.1 hypothetical protein Z520_10876 [Fonsecaea multimorphosa CBS 102226]
MGSVDLIASLNARGPTSGFTDVPDNDESLPDDFQREKAKLFNPLKVGAFNLRHRIVHAALGRSRSAFATESPLAAEYFRQRTTPGSLVISQATSEIVRTSVLNIRKAAENEGRDQNHIKIIASSTTIVAATDEEAFKKRGEYLSYVD